MLPLPPFVASVPQVTSTLPTDATLIEQLRTMTTPEAAIVLAAFAAFGNRDPFRERLVAALVALDELVVK